MSKPDSAGAKSLEEILASIRKSLSGEGRATSKEAKPQPETGPTPGNTGEDDGLLSARLAGALNGPANGAAHDDDFSDLLAPDAKAAASVAGGAPRPADARDGKDPLWFLRQPAGGAEKSDGTPSPSARTQPNEPASIASPTPTPRVEEVKLSRPEVLRASLPPLFGADEEYIPAARTPPPEPRKSPPAAEPATSPPAANPAQAEPTPALNGLLTARTQPVMLRTEEAEDSAQAAPAVDLATEPAPASSQPSSQPAIEPKPLNGATVAVPPAAAASKIEASASPEPSTAKPAQPQPPSAPIPPAARTLEQVIGELLEPVIRQWLEINLPRMVEEVVRAEVARAIAAERSSPKM